MIKRFKAASPMCYAPTALTRLPPTGNPQTLRLPV